MPIWLWALMMGGGQLIDFLRTEEFNTETDARRDQGQARFDEVMGSRSDPVFGAPGSGRDIESQESFMNSLLGNIGLGGVPQANRLERLLGMGNSQLFDPSSINADIADFRGDQDAAQDFYGNQLAAGFARNAGTRDEGIAGINRDLAGDIAMQNEQRLDLGSTFGLLDLSDPDQIFNESITAGRDSAARGEQAFLNTANESFDQQRRLGNDVFDDNAFGGVRQQAQTGRLEDLAESQFRSTVLRDEAENNNADLRQKAMGEEMRSNSNLDQAIAVLQGQAANDRTDLFGNQIAADSGLFGSLGANLTNRLGGLDINIADLIGQRGELTAQGLAREDTRGFNARTELENLISGAEGMFRTSESADLAERESQFNADLGISDLQLRELMTELGVIMPNSSQMFSWANAIADMRAPFTDAQDHVGTGTQFGSFQQY